MKPYYLIQVNVEDCPMLYVSAKNLHLLLELCFEKNLVVTVFATMRLHSNPDYYCRRFNQLLKTLTKI